MPTPEHDDRPNVLFVFPDQHRPDWVGFHGDVPVRTPNLADLADSGVAFRNAVCPSPICGPSRACLASGREYDRCGVRDHSADYPLAAPTLYSRLRETGYHVLGTGKFDLQKHSGDQGLDGTNDLAANGFSDGVNNAGKWDAYGKGEDGSPGDPYTKYLHATFLEYAGLDPEAVDPLMDSQSVRPYLTGEVDADAPAEEGGPRDVVFSGYGPWRLAFDGRHKLVRGFDPGTAPGDVDAWDEAAVRNTLRDEEPLLFDHDADRAELDNVAADRPDVVERLDDKLDRLRTG